MSELGVIQDHVRAASVSSMEQIHVLRWRPGGIDRMPRQGNLVVRMPDAIRNQVSAPSILVDLAVTVTKKRPCTFCRVMVLMHP